MKIPNFSSLENQVRAVVDFLIKNSYSFTCWDITRQLSHQKTIRNVDHNKVRAAVEEYFFEKKVNNFNDVYIRQVTYSIQGAPQVYFNQAKYKDNSHYDKDFLDPLEQPKKSVSGILPTVYAVKDVGNNLWAGTKTSSGKRRWVPNLMDANFYGAKYRTAALIKANSDRNLEPVEFSLT